ncbi:MAG: hypothetical protein ACUVYA_19620 [Planctomycetota bacterium]
MSLRTGRRACLSLTVACLLAAAPTSFAASFVRSDANQDGATDVADPVYTLLYLFGGASEIECLDAADANDSGDVDISDAVYTLGYLFLGGPPPGAAYPECGEDPTENDLGCLRFGGPDCPPSPPPSGRLVSAAGCKSGDEKGGLGGISSAEDCIEWSFEEDGTLRLRHVNACFNCCAIPAAEVRIDGSAIEISESETYDPAPCRCLCLFDLELEITDLPPGEYTIRVEEVCGPGMKFLAQLVPGTGDIHCEKRDVYPWGA